jgi:hypothetical protein
MLAVLASASILGPASLPKAVLLTIALTPIRNLDVSEILASGRAFLSSASGLVRAADSFYVLCDDAHHVGVFGADIMAPGHLVRLLPDDLPRDAAKRKAVKPDFEILLELPSGAESSGTRLLAMGSGSTVQRMRGVLIDLSPQGATPEVEIVDLTPFFAALAPLCPEVNLEGACVVADRIVLFNRGNITHPETLIFSASLSALLMGGAVDLQLERTLVLPFIGGVPLSVTDVVRLEDGTLLLSVVAEATGDSYADGAIIGAAFVVLDAQFNIEKFEMIEPNCKIEGIAAVRNERGIDIFCVSDADDPAKPSSLYAACVPI